MKTYKIGNTEINEYDINNLNHDYIKFKFDELLEALSDKEESKLGSFAGTFCGKNIYFECEDKKIWDNFQKALQSKSFLFEEPKQEVCQKCPRYPNAIIGMLDKDGKCNVCQPKQEECERCKFDKLPGEYTLPFEYEIKHTCSKGKDTNSQVSIHSQKDVYKQKTSIEIADGLIQDIRPKQEECKNCPHDVTPTFTDKDLVTMPKQEKSLQFKLDPLEKITRIELNPKQSTSLKEDVAYEITYAHGGSAVVNRTVDNILKLIQSHLEKEVYESAGYYELPLSKTGYVNFEDIIKIINNLN